MTIQECMKSKIKEIEIIGPDCPNVEAMHGHMDKLSAHEIEKLLANVLLTHIAYTKTCKIIDELIDPERLKKEKSHRPTVIALYSILKKYNQMISKDNLILEALEFPSECRYTGFMMKLENKNIL